MKTLMLGNEAAARGLYEAGCSFVSSYPAHPARRSRNALPNIRNLRRMGA